MLADAISTLARRVHEKRREQELASILETRQNSHPLDEIEWLFPTVPALYAEIVGLVRASSGELNFNDALIALACRDMHTDFLASFDRGFDAVSWLRRIAQPGDLA